MKLLLDTHAFLWACRDKRHLPDAIQAAILSADNQVLVSAASIWEITIKAASGKQLFWTPGEPIEILETYVERLGATRLPISTRHALATFGFREWSNKDPFDRLLAAQALEERALLVTADKAFGECPVELDLLWA